MQRLNVNKLIKCIFFIALLGFLVPGISSTVVAEDLDFGEVLIGTKKFAHLGIKNDKNEVDIMIISRIISGNLDFTTNRDRVYISPGDEYELEVIFSPTQEGDFSDQLYIFSYEAITYKAILPPKIYNVTGIGIAKDDPTIEGLLQFYIDSVKSGDLIGLGKGKSADNRLNVFGGMLKKAEKAITAGKIDEGVAHLRMASDKINVFVGEGGDISAKSINNMDSSAISELKKMIDYLIDNPE